MTVDEIAVAARGGGALVAAFLGDGVLTRLAFGGPTPEERIGDIVLGRVHRFDRDLGAAFVDLGGGRFGFLARGAMTASPLNWNQRASRRLGEGDAVLVQIGREAEGGKAARLTTAVAVPGRTLILLPDRPQARVSRRVGEARARARLGHLGSSLGSDTHGWFLRHAAVAASDETIAAEAERLARLWPEILARAQTAAAPARLYRPADPVLAAIADEAGPSLRRIVADDPAPLIAVRRFLPELAPLCTLESGPGALFDGLGIAAQIDAALEPAVALAGGGRLHIAETPALIAIDVDSGARHGGGAEAMAVALNSLAVEVLAREIGLRELAGHIVVDFAPMRRRSNRDGLVERLRLAFATDRQETQVAGYTRLGKVELMRRRTGPSLRQRLCAACPTCGGNGAVRAPAHPR